MNKSIFKSKFYSLIQVVTLHVYSVSLYINHLFGIEGLSSTHACREGGHGQAVLYANYNLEG